MSSNTTKNSSRPAAQTAFRAAMDAKHAARAYAQARDGIYDVLTRSTREVESAARYGETLSHRAGAITQEIMNLTGRMRFDLLAKYAGEYDAAASVVRAMRPLLDEAELAALAKIEDAE